MYRFPWYLTLVSTNHASSNPGLDDRKKKTAKRLSVTNVTGLFKGTWVFCRDFT